MSKQMLLLMLLLSIQGTVVHGAGGGGGVVVVIPRTASSSSSSRMLTMPESVEDKTQEDGTTPVSPDLEEDMVCEASGPCQHCGGHDTNSLAECTATGRKQAFRCWSPEGTGESRCRCRRRCRRRCLRVLPLQLFRANRTPTHVTRCMNLSRRDREFRRFGRRRRSDHRVSFV
jgi:hypothetical protein